MYRSLYYLTYSQTSLRKVLSGTRKELSGTMKELNGTMSLQ